MLFCRNEIMFPLLSFVPIMRFSVMNGIISTEVSEFKTFICFIFSNALSEGSFNHLQKKKKPEN